MKRISITLFIFIFVSVISSPYSTTKAYAFFDQMKASEMVNISIGTFEIGVSEWDPSVNYQIGDRFTFDGKLWEVRALGDFTRPPEGDKLRPFGPYQEITEEYRDYNTYFEGDSVLFEGIEYIALFNGLSGETPGTVFGWEAQTNIWQPFNQYSQGDIVLFEGIEYEAIQNGLLGDEPGTIVGWNALVDEWQEFNVYDTGDQVTFNGNRYEANFWTQGDEPSGDNVGEFAQWRLIETTIDPSDTEHPFGDEVLNATITLDGVIIVEDGEINTENAATLGLSITKDDGGVYWEFDGDGRLRIRSNGNIQIQQNFNFESLVVELP